MLDNLNDDNIWRIDLFGVLGVSKNAEKNELKQAYKNLAKKYHPDRYPANSPEQESAKVKFSEISQAYDILGNETKRNQYLDTRRLLHDHIDSPIEEDTESQQKGEAKTSPSKSKKKEGSDAEVIKKKQAEDNLNAAKIQMKRNNIDEGISLLNRSIELNPSKSVYHCELGLAYQRKGWDGMSQASFKQALVLDPQNQIAKIHYKSESKPKKKQGFFSNLFSKKKKP